MLKKCSKSLVKRNQIKPKLRFHSSKSEWQSPRKQTLNAGEDARNKGTLISCWWKCKLVQSLWKLVWRFLKRLYAELPYDPAIPLLGIYQKECKSAYNFDTYTTMFIAAQFKIAKLWNLVRCP
jgi:hypothetical protein